MKREKKAAGSVKQWVSSQFAGSQFRNGSYSLAVIGIVLVIVVLINMIVGKLPKSLTTFDISAGLIYETGEVTAGVLEELDKDVEILVVAENDTVDARIEMFLERYAEQSSHVKLEYRDPVLHPDVLTEHEISADTIVISCEDTGKKMTLAIEDMIQYDDYYLYYYGQYVETAFDGEGQITSAIDYVAEENTRKIYTLSGHQESALSSSVEDMLGKSNLTLDALNLMETDGVPADCDLLLINAPQTDLAVDELTAIRYYLMDGNNVMLLRGVTQKELTNFDALMEEFGLTMVNEYVADTERYYQSGGSYFNFFPEITGNSNNVASDSLILLTQAAGMTKLEGTEHVVIEELLKTSEKAALNGASEAKEQYLIAAKSTRTYTEADRDALFTDDGSGSVLMQDEMELTSEGEEDELETEEEIETEEETEEAAEKAEIKAGLMVLTAPYMIDAQITDYYQNLENLNQFTNMVVSFFDDVENISIPAKSLEIAYNTFTGTGIWSSLFIFIIPGFFIITGMYVWLKRRKA